MNSDLHLVGQTNIVLPLFNLLSALVVAAGVIYMLGENQRGLGHSNQQCARQCPRVWDIPCSTLRPMY